MRETRTDQRTQTGPAPMREDAMPQGQAPAAQQQRQDEQPRQQLSATERARRERYSIKAAMIADAEANRPAIERSLNIQGLTWDAFISGLEIGLTQTMKSNEDFFHKVSAHSFIEAVIKAAHFGLKPDGKEGAIVNYGTEASFLPMVEGFIKKLWQSGVMKDVNHNVVRQGDDIDFEEGDNGYVRHRRPLKRAAAAETIGAWCVINLVTGGKIIEVCDDKDLRDIAAVSKSTKGPRANWADEMHRKAPFRRALKRMPKDQGIGELIAHDDTHYNLAAPRYDTLSADGQRARRARALSHEELMDDTPAVDEPTDAEKEGVRTLTPEQEEGAAAMANSFATEIRQAADVWALGNAVEEAQDHMAEFTDEHRRWFSELAVKRMEDLGIELDREAGILKSIDAWIETHDDDGNLVTETDPPSEGGEAETEAETADAGDSDEVPEVPALQGILGTVLGLQQWEEPNLWMADLLAKFNTLKGAPARQFWDANERFVLHARDVGHAAQANKVLKVAADRGLYKPEAL